jgi:hypothetical protein
MSVLPEFEILKKKAEKKLSESLGGECCIHVVEGFNEETSLIIRNIDNIKFREELQYNNDEIEERMNRPGFVCVLIYLNKEPIAFEYGYMVAEGVFFSDSQATLIEGKGVGSTQFALEILYLYHKGYKVIQLTTEEIDEQGRLLRSFWERLGFVKIREDKNGNVDMELKLNNNTAIMLYQRYILPRYFFI